MATTVLIPGTTILSSITPIPTKIVVSTVKIVEKAGKYAAKPIPNP